MARRQAAAPSQAALFVISPSGTAIVVTRATSEPVIATYGHAPPADAAAGSSGSCAIVINHNILMYEHIIFTRIYDVFFCMIRGVAVVIWRGGFQPGVVNVASRVAELIPKF